MIKNKMIVSVKDKNYYKYDVIDVNTGFRMPFVQEVDDETGYFTMILPDYDKGGFISYYNE